MPKCPWDVNRPAKTVVDMTKGHIPNDWLAEPSGKARAAGFSPEPRREITMEGAGRVHMQGGWKMLP